MSEEQLKTSKSEGIDDTIIDIINMHKWFGDFHVLQDINLKVGRQERIVICGPSGSGKSTLIVDTLYRALAQQYYHSKYPPGAYDRIIGMENIDKVINIDQSPIGRSRRSRRHRGKP